MDLFTPEELLEEDLLLEKVKDYLSNAAVGEPRREGSVLFLRVMAKTAYFSSSRARMENPEPVDVDISTWPPSRFLFGLTLPVLDPYMYNIVPESLLKIIGLVVVVAISSWWLGGWTHRALMGVARTTEEDEQAEKKKHR